jgi:uncharacterized membrane protein YgcG
VAAGELRRPTRRQRRRIEAAVQRAEETTGLQLCIVLGGTGDRDVREQAESLFVGSGLAARPAVLVLVAPPRRQVEVVTAPTARSRISDEDAAEAVAVMTEAFSRGQLLPGLLSGLDLLVTSAGPGVAPPGDADLPNVVDIDEPPPP